MHSNHVRESYFWAAGSLQVYQGNTQLEFLTFLSLTLF